MEDACRVRAPPDMLGPFGAMQFVSEAPITRRGVTGHVKRYVLQIDLVELQTRVQTYV